MLGENATPPLYQGYLTGLRAGERWRMEALLAKVGASTTQVQVQIEMRVTDSGQISGLIQGTPIQGSSTFPGTQQE
jgi:hypothetical protein